MKKPMLLVTVALMGCHWFGSRNGDHGAKLVSCIEAHTGGSGKRTQEYVTLRYRVNRFGGVDAETIRPAVRTGRSNVASGWAESAAINTAASCTYEPAVRNGQPVDEIVQRTFLIEVGDVGATKFP